MPLLRMVPNRYAPGMLEVLIKNSLTRAALVCVVTILVGTALWLEMDARFEGYAGFFERRAARASGIISGREWQLMQERGDRGQPSSGGGQCLSPACRSAQALMGGRWRTGVSCATGSTYRFSDGGVQVIDAVNGVVEPPVHRLWRPVQATVPISLRRDAQDGTLSRSIEKRAGDLEVFTLKRSNYVRRIFRAVDPDTIMLVLVEQRRVPFGPAQVMIINSRATVGDAEVFYRRCPEG